MGRLFMYIAISIILITQVSWSASKTRKRTTTSKAVSVSRARTVRTVHKTGTRPVAHRAATEALGTTSDTDTVTGNESGTDGAGGSSPESTAAVDFKKLGDRYSRKGKTARAIEAYKQSLSLGGGSDSARSRMALVVGSKCYTQKKYEEALHYFAMVSGKAKSTPQFKSMVGASLQIIGQNDSAIAILKPFASNQKLPVPLRKDMFKILGDAYVALKNEGAAVRWYRKYIRAGGTKNADIAYLVALTDAKITPAKAPLLFERNIKSFPADYRNYLQLGILKSKTKATRDRSIVLLRRAISLADTIPGAWFEMGKIKQSMGKTEEAIAAYSAGLKLDDSNLEVKMDIGMLLMDKGSTEDAISYLEQAYQQVPDSIEPMALLASAYLRGGRAKDAVELLLKIKAVKPKDIAVRKQLVDAYQSSGNDQGAFEEIQGVLEVERDRESLFPYAKMLEKMGKHDEAVAALEEILGTMPDDLEALMTLANIFRQQKKYDEAVGVYKDVCSIDPKYAPALYERAEVHLEQGKVKWAEMFYQRALSADPGMALAEVGLAKLAAVFNKKEDVELHLDKANAMAADDPAVMKAIDAVRNPDGTAAAPTIADDQESGDSDGMGVENEPPVVKTMRRHKM